MCWSVIFCTSSSAAPLVVFGDLVFLEQLLQPVVGVAAHLPDGVAALLGVLVHEARHLLAALVGQRRDRNADDLAVVGGIEAEVGAADGLVRWRSSATGRTAAPRSSSARESRATPPDSAASSSRRPRPARCRAATPTRGRCARRPVPCARARWRVHALLHLGVQALSDRSRPWRPRGGWRTRPVTVVPDRLAHDDAPEVPGRAAG